MSVDLPAPFSPTSAWISPLFRSKLTPSSARTPGKDFVIAFISRSSVVMSNVQRPMSGVSLHSIYTCYHEDSIGVNTS